MDEVGVDVASGALPDPVRDTRGDHDELVRARSGELARMAYLVTGDRERAIAVTADALATLRDEWSEVVERGMPQSEARAAVVRRLLPTRRGRGSSVGPATFSPADADAGWGTEAEHAAYGLEVDDDLDDVVLSAYAAEPVATRIAFVLGEVDHLDGPAVAGALDRDVRSVDRDVDAGLDRIARARQHAADAADRGRPTEGVEAQLRRVLLGRAASAGLPHDLTEQVDALRRRTVRRRRLLTAGAGGLGLAVAGVVGGSALLRSRNQTNLTGSGAGDASATTGSSPGGVPATPVDLSWDAVWRWPARGSMATDPAALALARQQQQRVIYAERIDGVTLVVTAAHDDNQTDSSGLPDPLATMLSINVITASRSTDSQRGSMGISGTDPLAVATATAGPGSLVILAKPEVTSVDVSSTVQFGRDGTATRIGWQPLPLDGGVGRVPTPALGTFGMSVRYEGHHYPPYSEDFGFWGVFHPTGITAVSHQWDAAKIVAALTTHASEVACTLTGLPPADVSVTVTNRTKVPGSRLDLVVPTDPNSGGDQVYPPLDSEVAVLVTALPGGARLRSVAVWHPEVGSSGVPSVFMSEESAPYPAADILRGPVILQASSGPSDSGQVMGILALGAASIRVSNVRLETGQKATVPVKGGVAVFAITDVDETATITSLDAKGHPIGSWPFFWSGAGNGWDVFG